MGLAHRANELAGSLPYGEQRRLEIARALGTGPGVILLDEPAAGTNPAEKRELAELIKQINADGVGVLLIEHDMKLVMSVADRIVVLNFGRRIAEGTPEQIQRDPAVVAAYLGTSVEDAEQELDTHVQPELHRIDSAGALGGDTAGHDRHGRRARMSESKQSAAGGERVLGDVLLDVVDLQVRYGAITAIKGISFSVREGEIVALLGRERRGQDDDAEDRVGHAPARRPGRSRFAGQRIDGIPPHRLINLGVCHVPEGRHVFPRMTVEENLRPGRVPVPRPGRGAAGARARPLPAAQGALRAAGRHPVRRRAADARHRPGAHGQAQLLLLDEPSMGLAPLIVEQIFEIVRGINVDGVSVLLVEQNAARR